MPEPLSAPTVARIFNESLTGKGLREIAVTLNAEGVPGPREAPWKSTAVYKILRNEAYSGTLIFDRERPGRRNRQEVAPVRVEHAWQPLVDNDVFLQVQSQLSMRSPKLTHPRRPSSPYLLSSLLRCGVCGHQMIGHSVKHGRYRYYVCSTADKTAKAACGPGLLPKERTERFILLRIRDHVLSEKNLAALVEMVREEIQLAISQHQERREILAAQVADPAPRIKELRTRRAEAQARLDNLHLETEAKQELVASIAATSNS